MITSLISILVVALVLALIFYVIGMFIQGKPLTIIGLILGLILLLYALNRLGVLPAGL